MSAFKLSHKAIPCALTERLVEALVYFTSYSFCPPPSVTPVVSERMA